MTLSAFVLAAALLCGCGSDKPTATPPSGGAAQQADGAAYGEPVNGLRLGLSPAKVTLRGGETDLHVQLCYMNDSKKPQDIPIHGGPCINAYRLMFAGEKNGKVFYVVPLVQRFKYVPPAQKTLQPGERFSDNMVLIVPSISTPGHSGANPLQTPPVLAGESLTLRAGVCPEIDPSGEKEWNAPATLKSGTIRIARSASEAKR